MKNVIHLLEKIIKEITMKHVRLISCSLLIIGTCIARSSIEEKIIKYKTFLEKGTYESFYNWPQSKPLPLSRYYTFKKAFEHFEKHNGKIIIELGTTRSFTHGGHEGCNLNDTKYWMPDQPHWWDWGAGSFTRVAAEALAHMSPEFHTIDISKEHIQRCKTITADFDFMQYHV